MRDDAEELLKKLDLLDDLSDAEADALNVQRPKQQAAASSRSEAGGQSPSRSSGTKGATPRNPAATLSEAILEAVETCHHATQAAQSATDHALTLGQTQKESLETLREALNGWRRNAQQAQQALKQARRRMGLMLLIAVLTSAASLGGAGWLFYQVHHQAQLARDDLVDLMQTQSRLLNQKLTVKLDELASLVEMLQADIRQLRSTAPSSQATLHTTDETGQHAEPTPATALPDGTTLAQLAQAVQQLQDSLAQQRQTQQALHTGADPKLLKTLKRMMVQQQQQIKTLQSSLWKLRQQLEARQTKAAATGMHASTHQTRKELRAVGSTLKALADRVNRLAEQHRTLEDELTQIRQQLEQLNRNRPYSYRAPPMQID